MSKLNSKKWIYKHTAADPFYYNKKGEWVAWKKLTPEEQEEFKKKGKLSLVSEEGKPLVTEKEILEFMKRKKMERGVRESKKIQQYLDNVNKIPDLTPEEEYKLWEKIKVDGDEEATEKIFRANLKLVVLVAKKYKDRLLTFSELIREGERGLKRGIFGFSESYYHPEKFPKYALNRIEDQIMRIVIWRKFAIEEKIKNIVKSSEN